MYETPHHTIYHYGIMATCKGGCNSGLVMQYSILCARDHKITRQKPVLQHPSALESIKMAILSNKLPRAAGNIHESIVISTTPSMRGTKSKLD